MTEEVIAHQRRKFSSMAIEAVIIVLSILFAFAIDAWWDERKERTEEHEILAEIERSL